MMASLSDKLCWSSRSGDVAVVDDDSIHPRTSALSRLALFLEDLG